MKKIRVLFLSVQPSVLFTLLSFFASDPFVLTDFDEYNNYDKRRKKYDVVVFDDTSINNNGLEIIRSAVDFNCKYKKILYTESTDMNYLSLIESSSFNGIVNKGAGVKILEEAIIKVTGGERYYCANIRSLLYGNDGFDEKIKRLTPREQEVMQLKKQGYTNLEIAERLNISVKTTETHLENIKARLDLKSVKDLRRFF